MVETGELNEYLSAAYRKAIDRIRETQDDAVRRTEAVMESTSGWLAAAKAAAAQAVLEATRSECGVQVAHLIEAHINAGDQHPATVAETVRTRFLNGLSAPGLQFVPSSGPEAAALAVVAVRHAAEFESVRERIAAEVPERFRAAVDAHRLRALVGIEKSPEWRHAGYRRLVVAFFVVTLLLSLAGVSWLEVIRRAGALL